MKTHHMNLAIACGLLLLIIAYCTSAEVISSSSDSINKFSTIVRNKSKTQRSSSILPYNETPSPGGFWKTKREWRAYWVKDWTVKKIYVPVWKRVWGPAELREWVPTGVAKPHPGIPGVKHDTIIH